MDILLEKDEVEDDIVWGGPTAEASEGVEAEDGRVAAAAAPGGASSPSTRLEVIVRRILWYLELKDGS